MKNEMTIVPVSNGYIVYLKNERDFDGDTQVFNNAVDLGVFVKNFYTPKTPQESNP